MSNLIKLILTVLILGIGNWIIAIVFDLNSVDVSIPFAVVSIFIIYIFTNKSAGRIMDMQIQGQTGIRMGFEKRISSTSYVFIGSLIYFTVALFVTFFTYKDYFIN